MIVISSTGPFGYFFSSHGYMSCTQCFPLTFDRLPFSTLNIFSSTFLSKGFGSYVIGCSVSKVFVKEFCLDRKSVNEGYNKASIEWVIHGTRFLISSSLSYFVLHYLMLFKASYWWTLNRWIKSIEYSNLSSQLLIGHTNYKSLWNQGIWSLM